jgi:hypothetical protein
VSALASSAADHQPMNDFSEILRGRMPSNLQGMIDQFQQGQHDQVPDDQVSSAYNQVATQLPKDEYRQAAEQAFAKLSPEQRAEFLRTLQQQTTQSGMTSPAVQSASPDPSSLAAATAEVHGQQPNILQQAFSPGGALSNPLVKAAVLGITAMAAQRMMGGRR